MAETDTERLKLAGLWMERGRECRIKLYHIPARKPYGKPPKPALVAVRIPVEHWGRFESEIRRRCADLPGASGAWDDLAPHLPRSDVFYFAACWLLRRLWMILLGVAILAGAIWYMILSAS